MTPCRLSVVVASWLAGSLPAHAVELLATPDATVTAGGDLKTFTAAAFPYQHPLLPTDPVAQGVVDLRLKLDARFSDWLRLDLQPNVTVLAGPVSSSVGAAASGAGARPPAEAVSLARNFVDNNAMRATARVDRAAVSLHLHRVDVVLGRQPITFGSTFFFTPMDLVAPFSPVVVDREYKPGVDAVRVDGFLGTSGKTTVVAVYAGAWSLEGTILAGRAGTTLGDFDVGLFFAEARKEEVLGVDVAGGILGTAVRGEATVTVPNTGKPFLRAALGADRQFDNGLSVMGELYVQTQGGQKPSQYLDVATSERFLRGETWAMGRYYGALAVSYEFLPILRAGMSAVVNLADPSALLGPSLSWSVADNVEVGAGGYTALGTRPDDEPTGDPARPLRVRSEFGLYPTSAFVQVKAYF
jgi:hypothetical protein